MKKILIAIFAVLMLAGCKVNYDIKPDTIVDIPLHPTEAETPPVTEVQTGPETEPTAPATEPPTEEPTEAPTQAQNSSGGKTSGGKGSSGKGNSSSGKGNSGSKDPTKPKATEPPTDPPTEAPTEPPTEAPTQPPSYDPSGYTPGSRDRGIAEAVNASRAEAGLPPLELDTRLCAIASVRAWELSRSWDQSRPDGSSWITVLEEYGYPYSSAAENRYFGTAGAQSIVGKWMSSEKQTANILSESAAVIGVGSYQGSNGMTYVAAIFAG